MVLTEPRLKTRGGLPEPHLNVLRTVTGRPDEWIKDRLSELTPREHEDLSVILPLLHRQKGVSTHEISHLMKRLMIIVLRPERQEGIEAALRPSEL